MEDKIKEEAQRNDNLGYFVSEYVIFLCYNIQDSPTFLTI